MKKTVVTVVGKDSVGIIAKVCTYLANNSVNILDISQTIVDGFFNMMMIVDVAACSKDFETFSQSVITARVNGAGIQGTKRSVVVLKSFVS